MEITQSLPYGSSSVDSIFHAGRWYIWEFEKTKKKDIKRMALRDFQRSNLDSLKLD